MKRSKVKKDTKEFSAAVGRALRRAAKVARKTARMHGTPIYVWKDGKVVAEKPWSTSKQQGYGIQREEDGTRGTQEGYRDILWSKSCCQEGQQSPPPRKQQARDLNPWHITNVTVRRTAGPVVFSANHGKWMALRKEGSTRSLCPIIAAALMLKDNWRRPE
jgi:hypothetical protein